ncbi:hypothetical protein [Halalkalibacter okhensis]|uniref:hypothetical protein n=1 Tax=Halalkalibacter okhensis TaxID=333138 RepID=UPI000B34069C|nr:hypothetical protein [Halalkalibacter okhensis]
MFWNGYWYGTYNLALHGLFHVLSVSAILAQYLIGFIVAFIVESFIVGPLAQTIIKKLPYVKKKTIYQILTISLLMVTGMVLIMSLYGYATASFVQSNATEPFIISYLSIVLKNFIVAFPIQLIVIGPFVRYAFVKFVKVNHRVETA